jgi:hypothetical protein
MGGKDNNAEGFAEQENHPSLTRVCYSKTALSTSGLLNSPTEGKWHL